MYSEFSICTGFFVIRSDTFVNTFAITHLYMARIPDFKKYNLGPGWMAKLIGTPEELRVHSLVCWVQEATAPCFSPTGDVCLSSRPPSKIQ